MEKVHKSSDSQSITQSSEPLKFYKPLHAGFFLALFFDLDDGGDMFLRNAVRILTDYKAFCPRK
jgi:hypothetical protein